jgi:hypothetical protein
VCDSDVELYSCQLLGDQGVVGDLSPHRIDGGASGSSGGGGSSSGDRSGGGGGGSSGSSSGGGSGDGVDGSSGGGSSGSAVDGGGSGDGGGWVGGPGVIEGGGGRGIYGSDITGGGGAVQASWRMTGNLRLPWRPRIDLKGRTVQIDPGCRRIWGQVYTNIGLNSYGYGVKCIRVRMKGQMWRCRLTL